MPRSHGRMQDRREETQILAKQALRHPMVDNSRVDSTTVVRPAVQSGDGGSTPTSTLHLDKVSYEVRPCSLKDGQAMVAEHHYARGGSNTSVYMHGLYQRSTNRLMGVAWWIPPTRTCCESVNKIEWKRVLTLTRLVCLPEAPKNAASFLLAHSVRLIRRDGRFVSLVTYADEGQGHRGQIYRAANWVYMGSRKGDPVYLNQEGRQIARKAGGHTRTNAEMLALGYRNTGRTTKHKFVLHLT